MVSSILCGCLVELECLTNRCHGQCQYSMFGKYVDIMTPTGQMSKSLTTLPTCRQPQRERLPAVYDMYMHRLAIATIHHCSPPIYCIAPSKHSFLCKCPLPILHMKFNFTFCASISLPTYAYLSTYANLTAPVPAEGAIHETVIELLSVALLWVIAICRWWSLGTQCNYQYIPIYL